ncbi:MAG: hypothetical protein MR630_02085 [Selenomonas sp.]|jgi:hypothetical protein|uniref:hypothetical protein n=1 Tax=Selenomonas sp. TaxID=2053611 RepID=UPI0025D4E4A4|nr:hypothetical protein [Selenomonas sp.]MCI6231402.1 hypothetical protein [Selenomonas sp.]
MRKNFLSGLLMAIFTTAARQIRIFTCAVCLLIMTVASTASAELTTAQSALGGITLGAPSSYVRSVYGEGIFSRTSTGYKYQYNGAFIQFFVDGGPATVMSVDTWKNNGFATPAGVTVGMDSSILNELYGEADKVSYHPWHPYYSDAVKSYGYNVTGGDYQTLTFFVDNDEKINEIRLYWAD